MIGILGGTFDPIHHGHLRLALELYERLAMREVRLLLSARPPHRNQPVASPQQRLAMLHAAVADEPALQVDDREFRRGGPSYMADSLRELREECGDSPLCLIMGMDAFLTLPTWHEWESLIHLAHMVVVSRPDTPKPPKSPMMDFLARYRIDTVQALCDSPAGCVLQREIPAFTLSATQIRGLLRDGRNPRYLLPPAVLQYIFDNQLYQP